MSSTTRVLLYLYCCEGSRVLIGGFPRDHPFQSLDHRTAPHGWPRGNRRIAARRGSLYRHRQISVRWHGKHRSIACGFLPLHFRRWPTDRRSGIGPVSHRAPPDEEKWGGIRRTSAKFQLRVKFLPGHRRMSAGWVLYQRITTGFLQDSSHGSPCADLAIDFALLWHRFECSPFTATVLDLPRLESDKYVLHQIHTFQGVTFIDIAHRKLVKAENLWQGSKIRLVCLPWTSHFAA